MLVFVPDDYSQQLRFAIQRLSRRIRTMQASSDVTEAQRSVLVTLYNDGPQSLGSLSNSELVTPPSMNRTINMLIEAGLVIREASAEDARKIILSLSDAGVEFLVETRRRRDAWFTQQLEALTDQERAVLEQAAPILKRMAVK